MFSTGQHQLCMPTGQHQLCMLRTISNRIRIEYIWLQHMIQVRILGNNKGARHAQDLRQWPLSILICQTPAFLQQSFFPIHPSKHKRQNHVFMNLDPGIVCLHHHPNTAVLFFLLRREISAELGMKIVTTGAYEICPRKTNWLKMNYDLPARHLVLWKFA